MRSQCKIEELWRYASKNCGIIARSDEMDEILRTKRGRSRSPTAHSHLHQQQQQQQEPMVGTTPYVVKTFTDSASDILRKYCCVKLFNSSSGASSSSSTTTTNNNNNSEKQHNIANSRRQLVVQYGNSKRTLSPQQWKKKMRQCFDALIKKMKPQQIIALLSAVKSRSDGAPQPSECQPTIGDCILIHRTLIQEEEPHVIAYRLFLNPHINSSQLKRLPHCHSEHDPIYVCCNILHWARILETDVGPPPYWRAVCENKDISFDESFPKEENSITRSIENSTLSSQGMLPNLPELIPESLTTDGEGRRSDSTSWCKVHYWELKTRVGDIQLARKPSVNICLNSAHCNKEVSQEVSLLSLASTKGTPSPCKVENTRQKIGLGIVLSNQSDGVWLFNRSRQPIFVYSPTLCKSGFQAYKVLCGECLLAFDYQRARELQDLPRLPGAQAGPVDTYSMSISFVKGYGQQYKRQHLTECPCWLEVHFTNVER